MVKITDMYGAKDAPRLVVLDPLQRPICDFEIGKNKTSSATMRRFLRDLPSIDDSAGVPLTAPALIVPRIFEPEFCEFLIDLFNKQGGTDSGFMLDTDGKTSTIFNHSLKTSYRHGDQ
jgi:hypothetical protein